jgi:hypothetical protein
MRAARVEEIRVGREVVVHRGSAHAGSLGDSAHGGSGRADGTVEVNGGFGDAMVDLVTTTGTLFEPVSSFL